MVLNMTSKMLKYLRSRLSSHLTTPVLLVTALALAGPRVESEELLSALSGEQLLGRCYQTRPGEMRADLTKYNMCVSYLLGVVDFHNVLVKSNTLKVPYFCTARETASKQLPQAFLNYISDRSELLEMPAIGLVVASFMNEWPCP